MLQLLLDIVNSRYCLVYIIIKAGYNIKTTRIQLSFCEELISVCFAR